MKKIKKASIPSINPSLQVAIALVILIISILATRGDEISGWETSLFFAIYDLPSVLFPFFIIITQLGSAYMLWLLLVLYLLKRNIHTVLRLLMTGTLAYLVAGFVKDVWGRSRPDELIQGITTLDYVRGPGFPSGHMALAVALALTMGHYLPKKYHWLVPLWIIGVGVSRVYLGVHAPLDIVGGFGVGLLAYALFRHVRLYDISFRKKPSKSRQRAS